MCCTSLDWEKAFDRINVDRLVESMERIRIPAKYMDSIRSLYNAPQFAVKNGQRTEWKHQQASIRQECPLSPYLFIIVMTVNFRDVCDGLNLNTGKLEGLDFTELRYADDTALITKNVNAMNRFLAKTEECALYHGLTLDKTECVSLSFNCDEKVKYFDGTNVPCEDMTN